MRWPAFVLVLGLTAAGCSGGSAATSRPPTPSAPGSSEPAPQPAAEQPRPPELTALVTTELRNQVVALRLPSLAVRRRIGVPADPKTVAADGPGQLAAVISPGSGTVTLLGGRLHALKRFTGFESPQIGAFTPDGEYLLVTDAGAGTLTAIELARRRVVDRVSVGREAHHIAISANGRRAWVALGETASTIVIVDVHDPRHLRVVRRFRPPAAAHDLAFAPDGTVWVGSAEVPRVYVLGAGTGRVVATVPAGQPPEHVLFDDGLAFVTSGYGSSIEMVDPHVRVVMRRVRTPYGSFNLAPAGPWLVLTSVLNGHVTLLRARTLHRVGETTVATVARSVAVLSR
jgi:hypothetical protein